MTIDDYPDTSTRLNALAPAGNATAAAEVQDARITRHY